MKSLYRLKLFFLSFCIGNLVSLLIVKINPSVTLAELFSYIALVYLILVFTIFFVTSNLIRQHVFLRSVGFIVGAIIFVIFYNDLQLILIMPILGHFMARA